MALFYIFCGVAVAEIVFVFFGAFVPLMRDKRRKGGKRV